MTELDFNKMNGLIPAIIQDSYCNHIISLTKQNNYFDLENTLKCPLFSRLYYLIVSHISNKYV